MIQDLDFYFKNISFTDTKKLEEVFENLYNDGWKIFEDSFVDKRDLQWLYSDTIVDFSYDTFIAIKTGYKLYLEIKEFENHLKELSKKSLKQSSELKEHTDEQVSEEKPEQVSIETKQIPVEDTIKKEYISFRKSKFVKIV